MSFTPYSKQEQLNIKAGTPEADRLLARSTFAKRKQNPNHKYNARKASFNGKVYDSEMECEYAKYLEALRMANEIKSWTPQFKLDLCVSGQHIATYRIDFKIEHNDGRIELAEVKGAETKDWRVKWDLTRSLIPRGEIKGVPKDALLSLVKKQGKRFVKKNILLNYE